MFNPNANGVDKLEWTINVKHGPHELTFHSLTAFANFLFFPYLVRTKLQRAEKGQHHSIGDATSSVLTALRRHTGASLSELHDFVMGKQRLSE